MSIGFMGTVVLLGYTAAHLFGHDRPAGPLHKSRSAVLARQGMAATSQPLATEAALAVLRAGGSAVDAAIAANAVLGVVEPMSCGLGGDLFAIVWDAQTRRLYGLNASGAAPARATIAEFRRRGLDRIPTYGPLSWSVPGCVDGWSMLHERFGRLPWSKLFDEAIRHAEDGFPVSELIAAEWQAAAPALAEVPATAACFLPHGVAPATGDVFRNPDLAQSLRRIAQNGRDAFYSGPIAQAIADYARQTDALLTAEDLAGHRGEWVDPVSTHYRGYDVWELPPPCQGIAVLQILNLIEPYDLKALGFGSPELVHLMVEAKKLAYEDRARYYADPRFAEVPVARLISKPYARQRASELNLARASQKPRAGDPTGSADTIYLTVADPQGTVVSLIQSNFHGFGSHHVVPGLGFPLQNRGTLFALDPSHANRLEPGKRPFHTIIPAFVTHQGEPWASLGLMGGDMQAQGHAQVLVNLIDFGMDVQEAGDAPRWRHDGSSDPTGTPADGGGIVYLESGFPPGLAEALRARGHRVEAASPGGFGGYQAIRIDRRRGILIGGSDPRKDGLAAGF
ncbi:MAG: gamma-glutamyltranspeptidase [Isosphaeraceae bacterium]|jgi:gamma-glutamyltranspeptidase/glutathione hydrolase|nr:MAG: gamma-glutamyltranspeptidase [Isosphaeraceae bacterium]